MKRTLCSIFILLILGQTTIAWGFPWNKDFVDQLAIKAQESLAPPGPNSVPVEGGESLPSLSALITEQEMDALKDAAAAQIDRPPRRQLSSWSWLSLLSSLTLRAVVEYYYP